MKLPRSVAIGAGVLAVGLSGVGSACGPVAKPERGDAAAAATTASASAAASCEMDFAHRFPLRIGGKAFVAQVALTQIETANGLMGRAKLGTDEGMLFVFRAPEARDFWMRNVPIPLALGYITREGRLDEIKAMEAQNPDTVSSRSARIQFVLEMRQGWFEANGVQPGAMLDLQAVRAALRARGFPLEHYGL